MYSIVCLFLFIPYIIISSKILYTFMLFCIRRDFLVSYQTKIHYTSVRSGIQTRAVARMSIHRPVQLSSSSDLFYSFPGLPCAYKR